eukprot:CAMPEP_0119034998 /NCGR_PEP_ID=MMETSP1177-20130426/1985_1 /TAXON_ID=2985 /ORGANISM="Ochromonas sp, Strain CCMP1899" /LENGTH=529 /DNA_ID=CAMNT_0006992851 /DNA_START=239 /DNA_END=1824 /DNA_ORIENTATION=+
MINIISTEGNSNHVNSARTVQVIRSIEKMGMLIINDKENSVIVMLTQNCMNDMAENEIAFSDLKNCLIKLEVYHFSTLMQNRGLRDFSTQAVSMPIVIQCDKLTFLGGHDMQIIGEPCDLNKDPQSVLCFKQLNYNLLTERLGSRQFPEKNALPNANGIFVLNHHNDDDDIEISSEQQKLLDQIDVESIVMNGKESDLIQELSSKNRVESDTMVDENSSQGAQHYRDEGTLVDEDEFFDATGGCELEIINTQGPQTQESTQQSKQSSTLSQNSSLKSKTSQISQHSTRSLRSSIRPQDTSIGSRDNRYKPKALLYSTGSSSSSYSSTLPTPLPISHMPTRSLRSQGINLPPGLIPNFPGLIQSISESPFSPSSAYKGDTQPNWQTQPMTQDMLTSLEESLSQSDIPDESQLTTPMEEGKKMVKKEGKKRPRASIERGVTRDSLYDSKLVGRKLKRKFDAGYFTGVVEHYRGEGDYMIVYEDEDCEQLHMSVIMKLLLPASRTTLNSTHHSDGANESVDGLRVVNTDNTG